LTFTSRPQDRPAKTPIWYERKLAPFIILQHNLTQERQMTTTRDFNQRIHSHLEQLTKSEKKIAEYLQHNFEEAAFFPAADLAERLNLSEATVVRFAQSISFSGFPELRQCLQELFKEKVTHAYHLRTKLAELSPEAHILEQIMAMEIEYLTGALRTVSREAFDEAVRLIYGARRLFVYGLSGSETMAELLEHRLRRFGVE
jgi:DNA-binding MurR/RpiR family transcriptional regulator